MKNIGGGGRGKLCKIVPFFVIRAKHENFDFLCENYLKLA